MTVNAVIILHISKLIIANIWQQRNTRSQQKVNKSQHSSQQKVNKKSTLFWAHMLKVTIVIIVQNILPRNRLCIGI